MHFRVWKFRLAALLAVASFGVHQLRFVLAYGAGATRELAHQGHAYLSIVAPLLVGLLMLAVAEFAGGLARRRSPRAVPGLRQLVVVSSLSLFGVYCVQELAEGLLSTGHPGGLLGVFGGGGWLAVPLSLAAGLVVALLMRGAAAVSEAVARHGGVRGPAAAPLVQVLPPPAPPRTGRGLLRQHAPRAPPVPSV